MNKQLERRTYTYSTQQRKANTCPTKHWATTDVKSGNDLPSQTTIWSQNPTYQKKRSPLSHASVFRKQSRNKTRVLFPALSRFIP